MNAQERLLSFLKTQKCLVVATANSDPWICNIYHCVTDDFKIYFVSGIDEIHSRQILENPKVTFATFWFDLSDHGDRKGVQGKGLCSIVKSDEEIKRGVQLHNERFPEFAGRLTPQYIKSGTNSSAVWVIKPEVIKFWNDKLYPEKKWEEFHF